MMSTIILIKQARYENEKRIAVFMRNLFLNADKR